MNFYIEIWEKLQNVSAGHLHKNHYNFFLVKKQAFPRLDLVCRTSKRVYYQLFCIRLQIFQNTPLILCIVQNWWDCPCSVNFLKSIIIYLYKALPVSVLAKLAKTLKALIGQRSANRKPVLTAVCLRHHWLLKVYSTEYCTVVHCTMHSWQTNWADRFVIDVW